MRCPLREPGLYIPGSPNGQSDLHLLHSDRAADRAVIPAPRPALPVPLHRLKHDLILRLATTALNPSWHYQAVDQPMIFNQPIFIKVKTQADAPPTSPCPLVEPAPYRRPFVTTCSACLCRHYRSGTAVRYTYTGPGERSSGRDYRRQVFLLS
ncbi:hypothetical protein Bbelb_076900 [Branchiostoma belcheri]|nr:hypothetical protein Bbelb_076900 [Branchiostoma belcheri]